MNQFLVLFSFLVCSFCFSQRTITGTVTGPDGDEIMAAIVSIKGTRVFTETDFDGNYSLEASPEDVLVFSYTGYEAKEIKVKDQTTINIKLMNASGCNLPTLNTLSVFRGIQYETIGISYFNYLKLLPFESNFYVSFATNFRSNNIFELALSKEIRFDYDFEINTKAHVEIANFNKFQFHSYKLKLGKTINLFSKSYYEEIQIITGYNDYKGFTNSNNLGYGLGFEKSLIYNFKVGTSFIHWQEFNEFNANATYTWRRWSISGNYKHLADYEEFQIGLGYNFYF